MSVNKPLWGRVTVALTVLELNGFVHVSDAGVALTAEGYEKATALWEGHSDEDRLLLGFIARMQMSGKEPIL
jgi:Mn-dependent DtxR family transcriptional regulator